MFVALVMVAFALFALIRILRGWKKLSDHSLQLSTGERVLTILDIVFSLIFLSGPLFILFFFIPKVLFSLK
jgi:hypothetical protein